MTREEAIARLEANRGAFVFKETNEALDMAIEALSAEAEDTQTKDRARYVAKETELAHIEARIECAEERLQELKKHIDEAGWIPVKWHEITDEEREREGYPKDWAVYIDCEMPCDEQEILVQTKSGYVRWDVCYEDGEFSLDSGWDWIEDIVAWMPLPEPYKGGDDK